MSWWQWFILGVSLYSYLGLIGARVDRYIFGDQACSIAAFCCWWLILIDFKILTDFTDFKKWPRCPWLPFEPPPTSQERIEIARRQSLEMEEEAGLKFDGIFLVEEKREDKPQQLQLCPCGWTAPELDLSVGCPMCGYSMGKAEPLDQEWKQCPRCNFTSRYLDLSVGCPQCGAALAKGYVWRQDQRRWVKDYCRGGGHSKLTKVGHARLS